MPSFCWGAGGRGAATIDKLPITKILPGAGTPGSQPLSSPDNVSLFDSHIGLANE